MGRMQLLKKLKTDEDLQPSMQDLRLDQCPVVSGR
jgi:hypothetical protein